MELFGSIAVVVVGVAAFLGVVGKVAQDSKRIDSIEKKVKEEAAD